jgi:transcriptional regulator of heat shock response
MKMRDRYCEKQRRWHEFRAAERQRRIEKANQEELNYFAGVIADSQARRQYSTLKFKYTTTVRSHHQAAVTIQKAFREMKVRKSWQRMVAEREEKARRKREDRAARVIQKAWRLYKQYQLYRALNFKSVLTSPVITLGRRQLSGSIATAQSVVHTYERDISITGKLHVIGYIGFPIVHVVPEMVI